MEQQVMLREVAHRVFAREFNDAKTEIKGEDERSPSHVLSPLGAKVNRLFLVGVLIECENIGQDGRQMWRARVSDPTGIFTIYAGEYQPEASEALAALEAPCIVSVVGKARTYEPEAGQMYVSVRPETITRVDEATRDQWVLQAAEHTYARLRAMEKAIAGADVATMEEAGIPPVFAEGAYLATGYYGNEPDLSVYQKTLLDVLGTLVSGGELPVHEAPEPSEGGGSFGGSSGADDGFTAPAATPDAAAPSGPEGDDELETFVRQSIESLLEASPEGAPWDEVIDAGIAKNHDEDAIEEAMNSLMDKGIIYEPVLGKLKLC